MPRTPPVEPVEYLLSSLRAELSKQRIGTPLGGKYPALQAVPDGGRFSSQRCSLRASVSFRSGRPAPTTVSTLCRLLHAIQKINASFHKMAPIGHLDW